MSFWRLGLVGWGVGDGVIWWYFRFWLLGDITWHNRDSRYFIRFSSYYKILKEEKIYIVNFERKYLFNTSFVIFVGLYSWRRCRDIRSFYFNILILFYIKKVLNTKILQKSQLNKTHLPLDLLLCLLLFVSIKRYFYLSKYQYKPTKPTIIFSSFTA